MQRFIRTKLLVKEDGIEKIQKSKVLLFGVGGVGGYVAEALARIGVSRLDVVDGDIVTESNINRQIVATYETVGEKKVDVIKKRLLTINPNISVRTYPIMYMPNSDEINFQEYEYIIDAIDMVSSKIDIILKAKESNIYVISAMGAGNTLDASKFEISDIYKTSNCPLARVIRHEMRKNNIKGLDVVYSKSNKIIPEKLVEDEGKRKKTPGSIAYAPAICGLLIAQRVVEKILERNK